MRTLHAAAAALALLAASPAAAQLSNRSIAVETGASVPLAPGAEPSPELALVATSWLEGPAEALARVAFRAGRDTAGRAAAGAVTGTVGLRFSLLPDPLRPQLSVEAGWARLAGSAGEGGRLVLAAGAGIEWFPARDLSVALRGGLRALGGALSSELATGVTAYF